MHPLSLPTQPEFKNEDFTGVGTGQSPLRIPAGWIPKNTLSTTRIVCIFYGFYFSSSNPKSSVSSNASFSSHSPVNKIVINDNKIELFFHELRLIVL